MKKIVVIAVAILLILGGASFSVLKWLQVGPFAPEMEQEEASMADQDEPHIFIDLDPLLVNIFQGDTVVTTVQITVKLETLGKDNASLVNKNLPKIADVYLRDLHGFLPILQR